MSDFGVITEAGAIQFKRVLPGPIERVWAYLTEADKRAEWFAGGDFELRKGGKATLVFNHSNLTAEPPPEKHRDACEGSKAERVITQCEPPRLLAFTWGEGAHQSEVVFELTPQGKDVLLVLTHRRVNVRTTLVNVSGGWHTHLNLLEDKLKGAQPRLFWATFAQLEAEYEKKIPA